MAGESYLEPFVALRWLLSTHSVCWWVILEAKDSTWICICFECFKWVSLSILRSSSRGFLCVCWDKSFCDTPLEFRVDYSIIWFENVIGNFVDVFVLTNINLIDTCRVLCINLCCGNLMDCKNYGHSKCHVLKGPMKKSIRNTMIWRMWFSL